MVKSTSAPARGVAELYREMERAIDAYVAAIAPNYPGIPCEVIRRCEMNAQGGRCVCRAYTFRPSEAD